MTKRRRGFICHNCQVQLTKWMGHCPHCGAWNQVRDNLKGLGDNVISLHDALRSSANPVKPPQPPSHRRGQPQDN